jgi:hypothetical protein
MATVISLSEHAAVIAISPMALLSAYLGGKGRGEDEYLQASEYGGGGGQLSTT